MARITKKRIPLYRNYVFIESRAIGPAPLRRGSPPGSDGVAAANRPGPKRLLFRFHIMLMIRYCFFFLLSLSLTFAIETKAQDQKGITISGIVVNADSLQAVPYSTITINNLLRGTFSDNSGHFSFIASPGDTLQFSSVGYKTDTYVLPTTLIGDHYSIIEVLVTDTILLEEVVIHSFPSVEEFAKRFLELNVPDHEAAHMMAAKSELQQILEEDIIFNKYPVYDVNDGYTRIYNSGIIPPNNLLNPIAWSNYIDDIRKSRQLSRRK